MTRRDAIRNSLIVLVAAVAGLVLLALVRGRVEAPGPVLFDGARALAHVEAQVALGPRITGGAASLAAGDAISATLAASGWQVEFQPFDAYGTPARNIIARANVGQGPVVIVGAHYDSRRRADQDPSRPTDPVPGANDGASGVAVLLELGRCLDLAATPYEVWLAFFDAEDNGDLDGWDWIAGSRYMAENLAVSPQAMILVDMVGDADQVFHFEGNSDAALRAGIWSLAADLGYAEHFVPELRYTMLDDHVPFAQRGIPAVDIIDFDYPYWHTTADTPDKVSAASLERVGRTLEAYLERPAPPNPDK